MLITNSHAPFFVGLYSKAWFTIYDLLSIVLQRGDYYVLTGVDTKQKLGEFHITVARRKSPDSWVAQSDYVDAKQVGQKIKNVEQGVFYKNNYVGKYVAL